MRLIKIITAHINGYAIPTYNVDGNTFVVAEDLLGYGFGVTWNGEARTLDIKFTSDKTISPLPTEKSTLPSGIFRCNYFYTDIKTYVDGKEVPAYNIDGQTLIQLDCLAVYGPLVWDGNTRELRLTTE